LAGAAAGGIAGLIVALAASHLIGTPRPKQLWDEALSILQKTKQSKRSASGILFRRFRQ
jgi:hypothetical protein